MPVNIQHNKEKKQFIAIVDEKVCTLNYEVLAGGKVLDYYSTFVPSELRGGHIGEDMVKYALEYAKGNFYQIIPSCPFVKRVAERHPEYKIVLVSF